MATQCLTIMSQPTCSQSTVRLTWYACSWFESLLFILQRILTSSRISATCGQHPVLKLPQFIQELYFSRHNSPNVTLWLPPPKAKTVGSTKGNTAGERVYQQWGSQAALQSASAPAAAPAAFRRCTPEHLIWALEQSRYQRAHYIPQLREAIWIQMDYPILEPGLRPYFRDPFKPLIEYIFKKVRGDDAHLPQGHPLGIINTVSPSMTDLILSDTIMSNSELPTFTKEGPSRGCQRHCEGHAPCPLPRIESDSLAVPHLEELQKWVWAQLAAIDGTPAAFRETRKKQSGPGHSSVCQQSCETGNGEGAWSLHKTHRGRKGDISIRVEWKGAWDTEIAVFEFETEDADDVSCKRQQRKYEDIHGAGRTTKQTATLPGCSYGMKIWLKSDSLHLILALVDHTRHFARAVKETLSSSVSGLH
ncbi:MAG: hypothetical protein J3Q66DRAFT_445581 [Benniella sp.]|nr:MAG: hypothetical protein J3Q66DRAFT_445581 [Benniella sp.]